MTATQDKDGGGDMLWFNRWQKWEQRVEQNYKQYKKEGRKWGEKEIKVLTKENMTKQMICTFNTFIEVTAAR